VAGASALGWLAVGVLQTATGAVPAQASEPSALEERLAELEQTTVRTGSRRLLLNIYGQVNRAAIVTDLAWGRIAHNVDSLRGDFVRYDTPVLAGFMLSGAWNDDVWDVALRYQNGSNGLRFAGGAGYMRDDALRFEDVRGSASLIHDATGLYASVAGGWRNAARTVPVNGDDAHFHYVQPGISRQWLAPGKTTLCVDHGVYKNFNVGAILSVVDGTVTPWGTLVDTEVHRWGVGAEQAFDAANLLVYAQAHFYDPAIVGSACVPPGWPSIRRSRSRDCPPPPGKDLWSEHASSFEKGTYEYFGRGAS
jgi:hypothetical protein